MQAIKITLTLLSLMAIQACAFLALEGGTSKAMQEDFDKIRLNNIITIAELVEEYHAKTSNYPLVDAYPNNDAFAVVLASDAQLKRNGDIQFHVNLKTRMKNDELPPNPENFTLISMDELQRALQSGLNRAITLPTDPQTFPVNKPVVYTYIYYKDEFDVAAYLHNAFSFTTQLSPYNNLVRVSSKADSETKMYTVDGLMKQKDYIAFMSEPFHKG